MDPVLSPLQPEPSPLALQYETRVIPYETGFVGTVKVKDGSVIFYVTEITHSRQSLEAVLDINVQNLKGKQPKMIHRIDLRSNSAVKSLVTDLNNAYGGKKDEDGYNWTIILNAFIYELSQKIKENQTPVYATDESFSEPSFLLRPFLQEEASNIVFAQPEVGKSWFALRLAASLASGKEFMGHPSPGTKKTLYIDYEDSFNAYTSRLHKVARGIGIPFKELAPFMPYYKPSGSFKENVETIKHQVVKHKIDLLIIDAGGDAAGGSPSDEQKVLELFNALEEVRVTKLILHHEPKYVVSESAAFYGSMYWKARSRVGWRLELSSQESGSSIIKATIQKRSNLPYQEPMYYRIAYDALAFEDFESGNTIPAVTLTTISADEIDNDKKPEEMVLKLIEKNPDCTSEDLSEYTGYTQRQVRRILSNMSNKLNSKKVGKSITYNIKSQ